MTTTIPAHTAAASSVVFCGVEVIIGGRKWFELIHSEALGDSYRLSYHLTLIQQLEFDNLNGPWQWLEASVHKDSESAVHMQIKSVMSTKNATAMSNDTATASLLGGEGHISPHTQPATMSLPEASRLLVVCQYKDQCLLLARELAQ